MRYLTRVRQESEGFTLVEAMVSLVIIFGLLVILLRTFDTGTRVIVETRRQQAASAFASELIERGQALEWENMGLATSTKGDSCVDEQVGCYDGGLPFDDAVLFYDAIEDTYFFDGERVVFTNNDTFRPFLNFHDRVDRGETSFNRYLFVTSIEVAGEETARRLTAVVQWTPPSGFRKEVRLETIVSEYVEPSQPLVTGNVRLSGGSLTISESGSGIYGAAYSKGTDWAIFEGPTNERFFSSLNERDLFVADIGFPSVDIDASSDFVSSAQVSVSSIEASRLVHEGADGVFGTADDEVSSIPPNGLQYLTDDDASSLPPLNLPLIFNDPIAAFDHLGTGNRDIIIKENTPYSVDAELGTQDVRTGTAADDELPYAELNGTTDLPDAIKIAFVDYKETFVRDDLYAGGGIYLTDPLDEPSYEFRLLERSNPAAGNDFIELDAFVDRKADGGSNWRQVESAISSYDGGRIYFLDDDAYPTKGGPAADFQGWVRITLPTISVATTAGEEVVAPVTIYSMGNLVIEQWVPGSGYTVTATIDYEADTGTDCFSGSNYEQDYPLWGGGVATDILTTSGSPFLEYAVSGTVTVRGYCTGTEATGALPTVTTRALFETKLPMVSVDLDYFVLDYAFERAGLGTPHPTDPYATDDGRFVLYDLGILYESEKLSASSVYIDPSLN